MEIQGYGEDTSSAVLGTVFTLVGQTTPYPFPLTTLPSFQDSLSGPKYFCLAALLTCHQPSTEELASLLYSAASGPLHLLFSLPAEPCQLLLSFLALTCPTPRLDQGSPNMLRELCPSVHALNSQLLEGKGFLVHSHRSRAGWAWSDCLVSTCG